MESYNPDESPGYGSNTSGDISPPPKKQYLELNNSKNIDDISTPSELKFDQGIVNKCYAF